MRIAKDNLNNKNEKKKLNKNKSLIQEKPRIKYKIENPYLQEKLKKFNNLAKEKPKEKNLKELHGSKQFQSNTNIYKNNKKIQNKNNPQIGKGTERTSIYTKNKTFSVNSNNNINIGNNINIITNNHIHEANIPNKENKFQSNLINNREILTDYNLSKKTQNEIYNNNIKNINNLINTNNDNNERMNRIKQGNGNENRKYKGKNTSMEHRYRRFNKEIIMSDGDLMNDEDNLDYRRNHIYSHPYKCKSPNSLYNNTYKYQYNIDKENNYFYNKDFENLDEGGETFYNNFYKLKYIKKSFNNNINNRNKYNSLINYGPNKYNYTNDIQSKTSNSFYVHKSPINTHNDLNNNIITNRDYSNDIDDDENIYTNYMNYMHNKKDNKDKNNLKYKGRYHSMIEENDLPLSPSRNYANTSNNYMDNNSKKDEFKSIRRSKNKIRIVKKNNNTSIQEYNLSLGDDDTENYQNKNEYNVVNDIKRINNINLNDIKRINNINLNEKTDLKKYFNHFSKNIRPITNSQFNINSIIPKNTLPTNNFNTINQNNNIGSSSKKKTNISNNESNISNIKSTTNNLVSTPNFSDTGKTPKRPNNIINPNQKINSFNKNDTNNDNNNNSNSINNSYNEDNSQYKIMVKKRPKNDIPLPLGGIKRRNSSSISLNKNLNKIINNNFEICKNENINYISNIPKEKENQKINQNKEKENKFIFDSENEMIDYIYNKFEEERKKKSYFNRKLRFTGFVLSKKYKGKNLYDIRIEDNIDKINQQLKDEKVLISDKQVEFIFLDKEKIDNKNINNNDINNNELIEENKQLKLEKEKMNKKDIYKNELIKKLDNEKQNFIEEIEKLKNEIEELKKENNKYKLQNKNDKENNGYVFEIEKNNFFDKNKLSDKNKMDDKKSEEKDNLQNDNIIRSSNNNDIVNFNYNSDIDNKNFLPNQSHGVGGKIKNKEKNVNENNLAKKEKKLAFLIDKIMNKNNNKNEELISDKEEINKEKVELTNLEKEKKENDIFYNQALEQKENLEKNNIIDFQTSNKEEVN